MDRHLKRFAFGSSSPTHTYPIPAPKDHRRNSVGSSPQHIQSMSDPSSQIDRRFEAGPGTCRPMAMHTTGSTPRARVWRRQSDSLQLPGSSASISPVSSPTTPEEQPVTGSRLKMRISQVIRSGSLKRAVKGVGRNQSMQTDHGPPPCGRTSAETLDVLRATDDLGLTPPMRASSWGSPRAPPPVPLGNLDGQASLDATVSEAGLGAGVLQDFNKSVVRFGAGGYVDGPAMHGPAVATAYRHLNAPGASGSRSTPAGMTHSDSSSNSTATAGTPHQHVESGHSMRVTSPLAREEYSEDEEELSSDAFEDTGTEDQDDEEEDEGEDEDEDDEDDEEEEEDDMIHLRSRRPSAILSRSANASPLR